MTWILVLVVCSYGICNQTTLPTRFALEASCEGVAAQYEAKVKAYNMDVQHACLKIE